MESAAAFSVDRSTGSDSISLTGGVGSVLTSSFDWSIGVATDLASLEAGVEVVAASAVDGTVLASAEGGGEAAGSSFSVDCCIGAAAGSASPEGGVEAATASAVDFAIVIGGWLVWMRRWMLKRGLC